MASFARPIFVSLLCGMALLGQAPAWLHVAGCEHESHAGRTNDDRAASTSKTVSTTTCSHGCCHHSSRPTEAEPESGKESGDSGQSQDHEHDSGTCAVCQSLAVPNGIVWQLDFAVNITGQVGLVSISRVRSPGSTGLSIPQPRGPPTPLA